MVLRILLLVVALQTCQCAPDGMCAIIPVKPDGMCAIIPVKPDGKASVEMRTSSNTPKVSQTPPRSILKGTKKVEEGQLQPTRISESASSGSSGKQHTDVAFRRFAESQKKKAPRPEVQNQEKDLAPMSEAQRKAPVEYKRFLRNLNAHSEDMEKFKKQIVKIEDGKTILSFILEDLTARLNKIKKLFTARKVMREQKANEFMESGRAESNEEYQKYLTLLFKRDQIQQAFVAKSLACFPPIQNEVAQLKDTRVTENIFYEQLREAATKESFERETKAKESFEVDLKYIKYLIQGLTEFGNKLNVVEQKFKI